ncbi:MAG: dTDP-4-dehydrorhamnose 3,5-epimerase [Bacteroidales bacterium]|jgi:dTDP-4-dehydrorhamnose 3,5-epimerase|nr:dTDP-4-dehydrorhamnose 3,5-epimerase [Bacteroidales bacterium]
MQFIETAISGVWIIEPKVLGDHRGYFMETFRHELIEKYVGKINFIQDNESCSSRGVLRGLHYQAGKFSQAKLVRVISGKALDVAVDIRKSSPTFGNHVAIELSGENKRQFFIPRGFAHGFLVLQDNTVFSYKVDNVYAPTAERSILFCDPAIGINWTVNNDELLLSEKDRHASLLENAELF